MDDELIRHLREMTSELRKFSSRLDDDFERLIDNFDTILDGASARVKHTHLPELSIADGFLSQIPEWVVVYDTEAANQVVWYNRECEDLFGLPLAQALENKLHREDLLILSRCHFDIGGGYDEYVLPGDRREMGKPHAFELLDSGIAYKADLTFKFEHYEKQLSYRDYSLLEGRANQTDQAPSNARLLSQLLENLPLVAAVKSQDGRLEWCNPEFLHLVQRLSPSGTRYSYRDDLYGKTSVQIFRLESAQAQRLTNLETMVVDKKQPVIAHDQIHSERRLTLRFPIVDHSSKLRYIGVVSMQS